MKKILLAFIVFSLVQLAFGQEKPLTQAEYVKMLYSANTDPSVKTIIIEALRKRGVGFVVSGEILIPMLTKPAIGSQTIRAVVSANPWCQVPTDSRL